MKTVCIFKQYKKTEIMSFPIKNPYSSNISYCPLFQKIQTTMCKSCWCNVLLKTHQNINSSLNWATQSEWF